MLGLNYLTAEAWGSPAITMLMDVVSQKNMGFAVSAYLFLTTISGMISTALLGWLQNQLDAETNTSLYGYTLAIFMAISYVGCIPCFYMAGRSYTQSLI